MKAVLIALRHKQTKNDIVNLNTFRVEIQLQ